MGVLVAVSPTAVILDGMLAGRFRYVLSIELLAEYREVLLRPKIARRHKLSAAEVDGLLTEIAANGRVLDIEPPGSGHRKGDDHLRQILEAEPSALLITGDRRLSDQLEKSYRVMTARTFAEILAG